MRASKTRTPRACDTYQMRGPARDVNIIHSVQLKITRGGRVRDRLEKDWIGSFGFATRTSEIIIQ